MWQIAFTGVAPPVRVRPVGSVTERPPIWLLPRPLGRLPALGAGHPRLALAVAAAGMAALACVRVRGARVAVGPRGLADRAAAVRLLCLRRCSTPARDGLLDAAFVGALLGVVLLGPLAGALIFAAPELAARNGPARDVHAQQPGVVRLGMPGGRPGARAARVQRPHNLGASGTYLAVTIAGLALILVNYLYITVVSAVVRDGMSLSFLVRRDLVPTMPVNIALIAAGVLTALLYTEISIAGLLPLAALVFIPLMLVPELLRDIRVWGEHRRSDRALCGRARGRAGAQLRPAAHPARCRDARRRPRAPPRAWTLRRRNARRCCIHMSAGGAAGGSGCCRARKSQSKARNMAVAYPWAALTASGGPRLAPQKRW